MDRGIYYLPLTKVVFKGPEKLSGRLKDIQSMADMLKQGGTLTEFSCPACASPLFRLKSGQLWCVKCKKRVVVVKEGEQPIEKSDSVLLTSLESTLLKKIEEMNTKIREEKDPEQLQKLGATLSALLENLDKARKIKGT
ncbi:MAG: autoantigen p27 domain-containing protein [Candidatus Bathyarchaeota archaeon]|nr:autoantigen p27 domain-containing protein [Candidatus Bathyarchaeota archaeon]